MNHPSARGSAPAIEVNPWANPANPARCLPSRNPLSAQRTSSLDAVIRHHVQYVLDLNRGNKLRAARQLAISRSTLYRILGNEDPVAR